MPMIQHEGVGRDAHSRNFHSFLHEPLTQAIVFLSVEHLETAIRTVENMIHLIPNINSCETWHG